MFIYKKDRALSLDLCQSFIREFELSEDKKPGVLYEQGGFSAAAGKSSTDITLTPQHLQTQNWGPILIPLVELLESSLVKYYTRHQTAFSKLDSIRIDNYFNIQRYNPGESFSTYHCERAGLKHSHRVLVWMIYLNTVSDQGETEFYYQHHFESPEAGKLLIWPSDWTYLHRGVPSPTETKYILTGWYSHY